MRGAVALVVVWALLTIVVVLATDQIGDALR
jgi:hypothetical protein